MENEIEEVIKSQQVIIDNQGKMIDLLNKRIDLLNSKVDVIKRIIEIHGTRFENDEKAINALFDAFDVIKNKI